MVVAKKFILAKQFDGEPKLSDFKLETEELKPIQDGEVLVELEWLSVDPYMRAYMSRYPAGTEMIGGQIAKILESKNKDYPVGAYIFGRIGWRTHTVFHPERNKPAYGVFSYVLPSFGDLPRSLGLGYLGMPGNTAYFGFLEICQPKKGEVVAVTGAAGAVGSLVGQIAKIKGCTVIGFAGDDAKVQYLKEIGFDYGINYKTADVEKAIKAVAPNGIDCYFDNVGGELSATIIQNMNERGRISVCGSISTYNLTPDKQPKAITHLTGRFQFIYRTNMVLAKKIILKKPFEGEPKLSDFKLETEYLKPIKNGEVLVELEWLSVDPYQRAYMARFPPESIMVGGQIAKVLESKHKDYPVGAYIFGQLGWRTHSIFDPEKDKIGIGPFSYVLPDFGNLPRSLGLGYLGMPGNSAYFGFLEVCKPKEGEVVAVSGAGGAVGSLVGQIAKIKGCTVIGFAGNDAKNKYLKEKLGFDHVINYKTADIDKAIKAAAPNGIDCYFDNVGGELSGTIIQNMNERGRISVCGAISTYNLSVDKQPKVPILQPYFVFKQLRMEGFYVSQWTDQWLEGIDIIKKWIDSGDVKYEETVTKGFENTPQAFIDMLRGKNTGKAVVKA